MYGNNVSHAKNRTKRVFRPNLHAARIVVGGIQKKVKLCTKCQRILKADNLNIKEVVAEVVTPAVA